jgi:hypothetical protein
MNIPPAIILKAVSDTCFAEDRWDPWSCSWDLPLHHQMAEPYDMHANPKILCKVKAKAFRVLGMQDHKYEIQIYVGFSSKSEAPAATGPRCPDLVSSPRFLEKELQRTHALGQMCY